MGGDQNNDLPFILYSTQINVFIIVNHLNDIMHKEAEFTHEAAFSWNVDRGWNALDDLPSLILVASYVQ